MSHHKMSQDNDSKKVVIVADWIYGGGAELVVEQLHKLYPDAPIYTSYCSAEWRWRLGDKVVTGYLQWWPFARLRKFLPLLRQWWFARLDLRAFDLIISSSGNGEAKHVKRFSCFAKHISYCHSPPHFLWEKYDEYHNKPSFRPHWLARIGLNVLARSLRLSDHKAAQKVDLFIANSKHIKNQIKKYYGCDSTVLHPPINIARFSHNPKHVKQRQDSHRGFIMWGRHVPYKRFDLAIEACNRLALPLTVVGSGPDTPRLKKLAGPTIKFAGRASDDELVALAYSAKAFIFPGEEDFGISPVEAMAAGLPVIAYRGGGALDYVVDDQTGLFFDQQTVDSLCDVLKQFDQGSWNKASIQAAANAFSADNFRNSFIKLVAKSESEAKT